MRRKLYNPYYPYYAFYPVSAEIAPESPEKPESQRTGMKKFYKPFLNLLERMVGKTVSVATPTDTINGKLENVFSDYILVNDSGEHYHIRIEQIIYVK
ncbi:hypothetical protein BSNK01_21220 [Bacillaceae bacterium]